MRCSHTISYHIVIAEDNYVHIKQCCKNKTSYLALHFFLEYVILQNDCTLIDGALCLEMVYLSIFDRKCHY